jgi:hypothetical protein
MPISANLNTIVGPPRGTGRPGSQPMTGSSTVSPALVSALPGIMQPAAPAPAPTAARPSVAQVTPTLAAAIRPDLLAAGALRPPILTLPPHLLLQKTATQLARGAINQLNESNRAVLEEAVTTVSNKRVAAGGLMNFLERRTKIGEVLNELARDWDDETKQDFAEAFQMDRNKLNVMDDIVAIAILNDPDLEDEIRIENTSEATSDDLMANRTIVWQHPAPGTPLDPPYLVLVAVEPRDVAQAEEVIESIMGQLVSHQGFKIPREAVQKLR